MESFEVFTPSPLLSPYIKNYWILEGGFQNNFTERIIPTGNIQLCFYRGENHLTTSFKGEKTKLDSSILSGQTTGFSDISPSGLIRIIAVVFYPQGANTFFHMPLNEVAHQHVTANDLSDKQWKELADKIEDTDSYTTCIRYIEQFLLKRLALSKDYQRIFSAIRLINQYKGDIRITELSSETFLSYKQFQRIFTSHVGINPKDFIRTIRFQYALSIAQNNPSISPSQLAYECGYYDQAHLINEFKHFSGYTPKEFFSICDPHSDYFS